MKINALTQIDFYKADHRRQYPEGTTVVYNNFTPRSTKIYELEATEFFDGKIAVLGLTGFIKWFLIEMFQETFFLLPKEKAVGRYIRRMDNALGKDAIAKDHIEALWDLGYLPIKIKALPEGSVVDSKVPLFTVENTLPEYFWLTNYLETVMSNSLWKTYTLATIAREFRRILEHFYDETGAAKAMIPFACHDFSSRGMSTPYDASMNGMAHLAFFAGTDTVSSIDYAEDYYSADSSQELVGASVPATEHSVMSMGTKESEIETFRRLITDLYPSGIVSIVSDTWDFWKVITEYTVELKEEILNRQENELGMAKVVFRPDSGDPVKVIAGEDHPVLYFNCTQTIDEAFRQAYGMCGVLSPVYVSYEDPFGIKTYYKVEDEYHSGSYETYTEVKEIEYREFAIAQGAVATLWDIFGGTETEKGYKTLNQRVGLIYGDSITRKRAVEILQRLKDKGFSADNIVFGVGSYTYQFNTRDTLGFAMKATYGVVDGKDREIFKDPVTDNGTKKSARGLLKVVLTESGYELVDQVTRDEETYDNKLTTVFNNGMLLVDDPFLVIKERFEQSL